MARLVASCFRGRIHRAVRRWMLSLRRLHECVGCALEADVWTSHERRCSIAISCGGEWVMPARVAGRCDFKDDDGSALTTEILASICGHIG